MPKFKKITLRPSEYNPNDSAYVDVQININSKGIFYCAQPLHLKHLIKRDVFKHGTKLSRLRSQDDYSLINSSYEKLISDLKYLHGIYSDPEVTKRLVIAYKATADIPIAVDKDNNIYKNAAPAGAYLHKGLQEVSATNPAQSAYSLQVGARVLVEITKKFGEIKKVSYENLSNHDEYKDSEAHELNKWCALNIASHIDKYKSGVKVVEYTPELAVFFDNLIMHTAKIALQFYEFFNNENHVELINSGILSGIPILNFSSDTGIQVLNNQNPALPIKVGQTWYTKYPLNPETDILVITEIAEQISVKSQSGKELKISKDHLLSAYSTTFDMSQVRLDHEC